MSDGQRPTPPAEPAAAQLSRELLQRAHEVAGIGTYTIDLQRQLMHVSAEMAHLYRAGEEAFALPLAEYRRRFFHPDDRDANTDKADSAYQSGGAVALEARVLRGDGEIIWVRSSSSVELNERGESVVVGVVLDVTPERRAQQALAASEQRFRLLIENAPIGIYIRQENVVTYANPAFERIFAYPQGEIVGTDALALVHPDDRQRESDRMRERLTGELSGVTSRIRGVRKDGETIFVELQSFAIEIDGRRSLIGNVLDVTARERSREALERSERVRNRAEEALRESELRLRQIAEGLDQVVWLADAANSHFLYVSPASAAVYGRAAEEFYADPSLRLAAVHPDDARRVHDAMKTKQARGDYDESYRIVRPDGEVRAIRDRAFPLRNADGEVYRIVGVSRDVTHERALLVAKDAAEQASRAKSAFLATMTHEIRTPMNAILGYAQLLRRDKALNGSQQEKVEAILSSGDHLLALISNVLEMSRIEAGRVAIAAEPFDLHALLDHVRGMFAELSRGKGVTLSFERTAEVPRTVVGDAGKIRQVLINLLGNALKFTERGHIAVRATADKAGGDRELLIKLSVEDSGPGIEAGDLARIFGAFEQSMAGAQAGGAGLGLTIGRELARLMGGDLVATSQLGVGTTFVFSFAAAAAAPLAKIDRGPIVGLLPGQSKRILVVDDKQDNRLLAQELLTAVGFDISTATSGEEGLEAYASLHPDLVLMDLRMPGIGGLEAIRRLRAAGAKEPLLAFTASGIEGVQQTAIAAGANGLLWKPYREEALLQTVGELLGVNFAYENEASAAAITNGADGPPLSSLLAQVPVEIIDELHAAVIEARPSRIEALAAAIEAHSAGAAAQIRLLAKSFQYENIASAVEAARTAGRA